MSAALDKGTPNRSKRQNEAHSVRAAERPLRHANQGAQGRIDGLFVREIRSDIR